MILNSKGLTSQQVIENRIKYGNNSVKSSGGEGVLKLFVMQFFNPIAIVLLFASVITLILREYTDSVAIVLVIFVNSLLGFYQEYKSKVTLKNLQNLIKPECFVIRDSKKLKVSYENIVVGDIVLLFPGDRVPADGVLLNASALSIDESILTGESQEIEKNVLGNTKDINNIPAVQKVYMGTVVTNGVGEYKVTKVGERTQFGKIASRLLVEKETLTPLQEKIKRFSFTLLILVGVLVVIILSLYTLRNYSFAEGLEVALIIAVSAIPEALLLSLTVSLSRSMYRLLSHKVLVRKLIVAETLGSITALCIDKTGTLTEGKMTIVDSVFKNKQEALLALNLNKSDINVVGTTILNWLKNIKADVSSNPEKITPFNSTNKYSLALLN